jgi:hypothetical protein
LGSRVKVYLVWMLPKFRFSIRIAKSVGSVSSAGGAARIRNSAMSVCQIAQNHHRALRHESTDVLAFPPMFPGL